MSSSGILYFLTNESMPGLVKIGHTTGQIDQRLQQLNTTGLPSPFCVSAVFYVSEAMKCEKEVHSRLHELRPNPKREFFAGSVGKLIRESIDVIDKYLDSSRSTEKHDESVDEFSPDKDDIRFMVYLLHDGYEQNRPFLAAELAEHHDGYAPLEVELKLMSLEEHGFVKRINREGNGPGLWMLLPKGLKYMFENGHYLEDLVSEARTDA